MTRAGMRWLIRHLILMILLLGGNASFAVKIEFHDFENKQQEHLYLQLIAELRCVKCQNQNLAESNAELASDMREKTYEMVINGKSRQDVVKYMTDRYGDFVLYKPPFKAKTYLLWIGPPILLFFGLFLLIRRIRTQQEQPNKALSDEQRESMRELLKK